MKRAEWIFVVAAVFALLPLDAKAYGLGPSRDPELAARARDAASYLKAAQLQNHGWAWEIGKDSVADNYGGLVAEALLAAYEQSGDTRYLDAARAYADELAARFARNPQSLPYKPDIELLVRMSEVSGEPRHALIARQWFAAVQHTSPTGSDEVGRIIVGRSSVPDLVGYDVALGIRAALAVEHYTYAEQLADAVLARRGQWLKNPTGIYGTVSRAALLDALNTLGKAQHASVRAQLAAALAAEQNDNGSWCLNETQATAYAVRALSSAGDDSARASARRGAGWLSQTLLQRGAWADYHDGMPEPFVGAVISAVNAEALSAVILAGKI